MRFLSILLLDLDAGAFVIVWINNTIKGERKIERKKDLSEVIKIT